MTIQVQAHFRTGTGTGTGTGTDTTSPEITLPVFTSSSTFVVDENVTAIGTVTAVIAAAPPGITHATFTIGATTAPTTLGNRASSNILITTDGVLSFDIAPDYDLQTPDTKLYETRPQYNNYNNDWNDNATVRTESLSGYVDGGTMDFTATVTATSVFTQQNYYTNYYRSGKRCRWC